MPLYDYECRTCGTVDEDVFLTTERAALEAWGWCASCGAYREMEMKISVRGTHDWGDGRYIEAVDKTFYSPREWRRYQLDNGVRDKKSYV